ncbi:MAG: PH domain-containing protein [Nakamurella sp.]
MSEDVRHTIGTSPAGDGGDPGPIDARATHADLGDGGDPGPIDARAAHADLGDGGDLGPVGTPAAATQQPVEDAAEQPWRRLATGMLLVEPVRELIKFIPMLVVLIFAGRAGDSGPPWGLIGTAAVIALGISRWLTTRYRITPTVVEVRRGLLQRKHLTVPRDRIRTVDVSAHPLQRVLHLVKVEIGTGSSHQRAEALKLDGLPAATAGPLRAELLHRVQAAAGPGDAGPGIDGPAMVRVPAPGGLPASGGGALPATDSASETELLRLNPRWIWYAPATLSGVLTGAVLIGFGWRLINEASIDPRQFSAVHQLLGYLQGTPLWLDAVQGAVAILIAISLLSLAGYVLSYWGYRLTRHSGGTLQVSRGLLTTRATSIEERRLRGVHRVEPLLLRLVGGARLQAIATGLRQRGSDRGSALLVPPAPLAAVTDIESVVLGSADFGEAALIQHGPAARRRRYSRALAVTALLVAVLWAIAWLANWPVWLTGVAAAAGLPVAALLAHDRYRNLGHAIVNGVLITRMGSLVRRRSTLAVPGVIGVTLRQSFFQRRSGLLTVIATTAAGAQQYEVPDVPQAMALAVAGNLVPEAANLVGAGRVVGTPPATALLRDGLDVSRLPA